jgi:hypothetical protein
MLLFALAIPSITLSVALAAAAAPTIPTWMNSSSQSLDSRGWLDGTPTFPITITSYGTEFGDSQSCIRNSVSCGFSPPPGYFTTAISQALFGASSGVGPSCFTCWYICIQSQLDGSPIADPGHCIRALADDLCPADTNALCANPDLTTPNAYGAVANFDLCSDSGATGALFLPGINAYRGWATKGDCNAYLQDPEWHN